MWISILKPEITGKNTPKNAKNNNLLKTEKYLIQKYKLSGGLCFYI